MKKVVIWLKAKGKEPAKRLEVSGIDAKEYLATGAYETDAAHRANNPPEETASEKGASVTAAQFEALTTKLEKEIKDLQAENSKLASRVTKLEKANKAPLGGK